MASEFGTEFIGPCRARWAIDVPHRYMVIHCTANTATPQQEARYAQRRTDGVGAHFFSSPQSVVQSLGIRYSTGHVGSRTGNQYGIAWEFCGVPGQPEAHWRACIDRAAPVMAAVMRAEGITARWLTRSQMTDGKSTGLVTHDDARIAWGGTDHTDPGPHFPRAYLLDRLGGSSPAPVPGTRPAPAGYPAYVPPALRRGSRGDRVATWQRLLRARGWTIGVDGVFGPETDRQTRAFQRDKRLTVDGIVGPITWETARTAPIT